MKMCKNMLLRSAFYTSSFCDNFNNAGYGSDIKRFPLYVTVTDFKVLEIKLVILLADICCENVGRPFSL